MGTNNKRGEVMMGTRYQVKTDKPNKLIYISFNELDDTTINYPPAKEKEDDKTTQNISNEEDTSCNDQDTLDISTIQQSIPDSVLQYERQMRKIRAADRASKTNVNPEDHLHVIYKDNDIIVTNKPSGILCVPGVNKNRSLLDLVFEMNEDSTSSEEKMAKDSMIVHRLDMDTSGIVIFARTRESMSDLHKAFRERTGTKKIYEALLVGWLDINKWIESQDDDNTNKVISDTTNLGGGEINLPLQRDHRHPPFMRVSTPESESEAQLAVKDLNSAGYKKLMAKKPKASTTQFRVLSHEHWRGHPVTRVELTPITGRTHQLRVHCAALGHPILADSAYGFCGEAHPNGGFTDEVIQQISPTNASFDLRRDVEKVVQEEERTMCLHARQLTVDHPTTKEEITFDAVPDF